VPIRLFDKTFGIEQVRRCEASLKVEGEDGYALRDDRERCNLFVHHERTGRPLGDKSFVQRVSKRVGRDFRGRCLSILAPNPPVRFFIDVSAWTNRYYLNRAVFYDSINDSKSSNAIASQTGEFPLQRLSACR
jgi:hypothetical protein